MRAKQEKLMEALNHTGEVEDLLEEAYNDLDQALDVRTSSFGGSRQQVKLVPGATWQAY